MVAILNFCYLAITQEQFVLFSWKFLVHKQIVIIHLVMKYLFNTIKIMSVGVFFYLYY